MTNTHRPEVWTQHNGVTRLLAEMVPSMRIDARDARNLWKLRELQAELDAAAATMVHQARLDGKSWAWIGEQLGVSKQAAAKRFGHLDDVPMCDHADTWDPTPTVRRCGLCGDDLVTQRDGSELDARGPVGQDSELPAELIAAVHAGAACGLHDRPMPCVECE